MKRAVLTATIVPFLAAAALLYHSRYVHPYRPRLERVTVPLPPGHEGLHGLRLGLFCDSHVGPPMSAADAARAGDLLVREQPDVLLLGGDYVSESPRFIRPSVAMLGKLARQMPGETIAVLGNHDLANLPHRLTETLTAEGIAVLRNASRRIETERGDLWIAGIDDALLGKPDPAAAFAAIPASAATIALWHEADRAERAAVLGAFLQLSGHSHGGQVRLPVVGPLGLPPLGRRYVAGLYRVGRMVVYTSRGVGIYRPPLRFNCPPEVTLITLSATARCPFVHRRSSAAGPCGRLRP